MEQKYDVFISYSCKDQKIAEGICGFLEKYGIRCFVAYRDIPKGIVWAGAIVNAIDESRVMVVVFSKDFNASTQTDREIEIASENKIPILTFRISEATFSGAKKYYLKNLNWIDAFPHPESCFGYLRDSLLVLLNNTVDSDISYSADTAVNDMEEICSDMALHSDNPDSNCIPPKEYQQNENFTYIPAPNKDSCVNLREHNTSLMAGATLATAGALIGGFLTPMFTLPYLIGNAIGNMASQNDTVYCSVFAPAEIKMQTHMLVQVYLHVFEETEKVKLLSKESQIDAERREYIPLEEKLSDGDKVDVLFSIAGDRLLMSEKTSIIWKGTFKKCSFEYFVQKDINVNELFCKVIVSKNGIPIGEMRFITHIVDNPREWNPRMVAHKYKKVFISYAHQDMSKVKYLAEGLKLSNIDYFFDRHYLKAGDIYPLKIQEYNIKP